MAFYVDEDEVWKCPKHPSKRRRSGICPVCLRDRLSTLCPDCANARPCSCSAASATNSSSSSSSRFSSYDAGRVSNLTESEPVFRRSRSLAIPFLRSRSRFVGNENELKEPPSGVSKGKASSFWSVIRSQKNKKVEVDEGNKTRKVEEAEEDRDNGRSRTTMMMRSRSVAVSVTSDSGNGAGVRENGRAKSRSWYFPSPMKVFRQSKMTTKMVEQRSPLQKV